MGNQGQGGPTVFRLFLGRTPMEKEHYTGEELAALFKEMREDYAAAKCEDAHWYGMEALRKFRDAKLNAPAAAMAKDRGIER
jgi:hypothetical protein